MKPEILILLSGGIDSAACVEFYRGMNRPICTLHVDYGQSAATQERSAAEQVARHFGVAHSFLKLQMASPKNRGEISGRNAFLILTALMERPASVSAIALGIHAGTNYRDCSPDFVEKVNEIVRVQATQVAVIAPFLNWQKEEILGYCTNTGVPVHLTYSCEAGGDTPCGTCQSCVDRSELNASA